MINGKTDVVILMGGASGEREVSLVSGRAVMEAVDTSRFNARAVELGAVGRLAAAFVNVAVAEGGVATLPDGFTSGVRNGAAVLHEQIAPGGRAPDIVFIALHGRYGEDGTVQGMLELLGIPYTGSGVLASALAMDKVATKRVLQSVGVSTPSWVCVSRYEWDQGIVPDVEAVCGFPAIVKPNREGSTIGCTVIKSSQEIEPAVAEALRHDDVALIEQFVKGVEITVGVLGNHNVQILPTIEICPKGGFYDYEAKYTAGMTEKIVPARIDDQFIRVANNYAETTHRSIGCTGMSRVDMIVTATGPTVLEVNTIPGMTPTSLLPKAAQAAGISFTELITGIIESGLEGGAR